MAGPDLLDLGGKVAFITGAGQGVGRGIALTLAEHRPAGIAVNDFDQSRADAVTAEIGALGVPAIAVQADVGDHASVAAAMDKAEAALGPITTLVNNAGNAGPNIQMGLSPVFWETDPAGWDRFFHTNLRGVMNCCHIAIPRMIAAGKGRIVTISSDAARMGDQRLAAYAAAKAGAAGFMRSIANEAGRYGITCNIVSLGSMEPSWEEPKLSEYLASEQAKKQTARYAIRRLGKAADVAAMVLFLCSDAAGWITGQTYPVNGGYSFAL